MFAADRPPVDEGAGKFWGIRTNARCGVCLAMDRQDCAQSERSHNDDPSFGRVSIAARPFTMRTLPAMIPADADRAAQIREMSRQRYGTDIASVQSEIMKRF